MFFLGGGKGKTQGNFEKKSVPKSDKGGQLKFHFNKFEVLPIWVFPNMVGFPPISHPKLIIFRRKTPWLLGETHHFRVHPIWPQDAESAHAVVGQIQRPHEATAAILIHISTDRSKSVWILIQPTSCSCLG